MESVSPAQEAFLRWGGSADLYFPTLPKRKKEINWDTNLSWVGPLVFSKTCRQKMERKQKEQQRKLESRVLKSERFVFRVRARRDEMTLTGRGSNWKGSKPAGSTLPTGAGGGPATLPQMEQQLYQSPQRLRVS